MLQSLGGLEAAVQVGGALLDYYSYRKEHPDRSPMVAAGFAALWWAAPGPMMALNLGQLSFDLAPALYMRYQLGNVLNQRYYRPNLGGDLTPNPQSERLAMRALQSGMSMRQVLQNRMGWEARMLYRSYVG